jgi:acetylornithine/N-succinyldiaminopimelate aminotransferase
MSDPRPSDDSEGDGDPLLPVYPRLPLTLASAKGSRLTLADGRELLDLYGGHAVTPLGHGHPQLARALREGYETLDFYSNSLHMPGQRRAARALLADSSHLTRVHFVNSGTEANEAALHLARRLTGRSKVLVFDCAFHGRTLASLQATGLPGYRARITQPPTADEVQTIRFGEVDDLEQIDDGVAAVLCESVPSLAGVYMPPEGYYPALAARCREVGALLIFDEVQGGVGRLGRWFAHQRFGVEPELVTLAKSLAGGFPAGALLCAESVAEQVGFGELGTTFGGGPLACVMIETVARVIREEGLLERVPAIEGRLRAGLVDAGLAAADGQNDATVELRGAGCLLGLQTPLPAKELRDRLLARDILVGSAVQPQTVRLLPPYILTDDEIERFVSTLAAILRDDHHPRDTR